MEQFDRVAIVLTVGGTEYIILETQLLEDYGQGQGPQGGVITVHDGWVAVHGAGEARLWAGEEAPGGVFPPRLTLTNLQGKLAVEIAAHDDPTPNPSQANLYLEGASATLRMRGTTGDVHAVLQGGGGNLWLGGKAADGDIMLFASGEEDNGNPDKATIRLDGDGSAVRLRDSIGNVHAVLQGGSGSLGGNLWLGGKAADGDIMLFASGEEDNGNPDKATIRLDGDGSAVRFRDSVGNVHAVFQGGSGNLWLGGKAADGDIMLFASGEEDIGNPDKATIHLDGDKGDITLRNADCAEDFDVDDYTRAEPGTVLVIGANGRLRPSESAYDRRVVGVVSGAGRCQPGIVLDRRADGDPRLPVAMLGKVYCKADATSAPIGVGDLLTTSDRLGLAMKAEDPSRAFGAVIGKALGSLHTGTGLVPILVALQ
jgi:hypothetical protein